MIHEKSEQITNFKIAGTGDIAKCYADPSYAKEVLGWEAIKTLDEMCEDGRVIIQRGI